MYGTPSVGCRGSIFRKGTSTLWLGCVFFRSFLFDEAFFHKRCSRHTFQTPCERATLFFASVDATDDPDRRLGLETGLHPKVDQKNVPRFARLRVRILSIYCPTSSLLVWLRGLLVGLVENSVVKTRQFEPRGSQFFAFFMFFVIYYYYYYFFAPPPAPPPAPRTPPPPPLPPSLQK